MKKNNVHISFILFLLDSWLFLLKNNIKIALTLLLSIVLVSIILYFIEDNEERVSNINLYIEGTIDPRLYAVAINRYKPTTLKGNECSMSSGWKEQNTGNSKGYCWYGCQGSYI